MGQGMNQGMNQGAGQGLTNSQGWGGSKPYINVNQVIGNAQSYVGESKKIMEKLKSAHIKAVEKIQYLETIKLSLDSEESYLRNENIRMAQFLKKNENSSLNDLTSLIQPRDERSEQILDLTCSIKAKDDCIGLLEERFEAREFSFDELCRMVRKLEEEKFENKTLLIKCTQ
jgi:predicted nucleic acid-binding protein